MMIARGSASLSLILLLSCDPGEPVVDEPPKSEPPVEPAPVVASRSPESVAPAEPINPPSSFDAKTATAAKVRIVAVHRDRTWTACGVIHSTGAIEVEVLEVGEPAPRMILILSCPSDFGHREHLAVGTVVEVKLFARRQRWPTPAIDGKLPPELPRRYVDTMTPVSATSPASEPAPRSSEAPE